MKIVPSKESKNFSSIETVTVPELSLLRSGGLSGVPGSALFRGEPRKKIVPSTPTTKPTNRTKIAFFISYGFEAVGDGGGVLDAFASMAFKIAATVPVKASIC